MSAGSSTGRLDWILSPEPTPHPCGPGVGLTVGVLALQGDFREHRMALEGLGVVTREVRLPEHLVGLHGLVVPGGESTTISRLMVSCGLAGPIVEFHTGGGAVFGTCAGLIVLARGAVEGAPSTLGLIDVLARRNAFGRQVRSFEADLEVPAVGREPVHAVFIRAPWIESAGAGVEVLAHFGGHAVAARQERVLVTAFHPELTGDTRLHELFIATIRRQGAVARPKDAAAPRAAGQPGRAVPAPVNC
jgi:5'-phosphate synthase pdxT subunit